MPGREAQDNLTKALNIIHLLKGHKEEGLVLYTDAEKAFHRVAWKFMLSVCTHIGLRPNMLKYVLKWILSLYQNPTARLKINGTLSDPVQIHNRTRQGFPLSLILFILTLEPFI